MKIRTKHRKLFYVPGMISLVLIPVLFVCYFLFNRTFEAELSMDLGMPDKDGPFSLSDDDPILNRNYKDFIFTGSLDENKDKLNAFQKSLKYQNKAKDTINGIRVYFGKHMKYEVFIRVLDILAIEDTPTYIPYKDQMLVIIGSKSDGERERKKLEKVFGKQLSSTRMNCGTQYANAERMACEQKEVKLAENENFQKAFFKKHSYLFLGYFVIALLNIYMLIKFNRGRIYNQKSYI